MTQRTFLVTGATKGIGLAISKRLANAGHQVIGIARGPLSTFPGTLVSVDLSDDQASARVISDLVGRLSFDGVVNNAGFGKHQRLEEVDLRGLDEFMHFNLHAPIIAVQAILPTLRQKGLGTHRQYHYPLHSRDGWSHCVCRQQGSARKFYTVDTVSPGPIETGLFRKYTVCSFASLQLSESAGIWKMKR